MSTSEQFTLASTSDEEIGTTTPQEGHGRRRLALGARLATFAIACALAFFASSKVAAPVMMVGNREFEEKVMKPFQCGIIFCDKALTPKCCWNGAGTVGICAAEDATCCQSNNGVMGLSCAPGSTCTKYGDAFAYCS